MSTPSNDDLELELEVRAMIEASGVAEMENEIYLEAEDLDLEACPPDYRYIRGDKEAWVYEHGNVAELVFVKVD